MDSSSLQNNGSLLSNYTSRFASRLLKSSEIEDEEITLITRLGSGTFGTVWKGECFGSTVAIKVPIPEKASALTREEIQHLRNEINIMTTNLHPNLILCLGACTEPSKFKIVLELMDGDLERLLIKSDSGKKMTTWQRLALAKDAARGMLWLHSMNPAIIHRDLKLENLMYKKIDKSYHVKISDFGLSILKPQRISRLRGERVGTLITMAPEILKGSKYNEKADVYSFAMLLWQIHTCERLYADLDDLSNEALEARICKNEIRPKIPKDCLPSLAKLMEDCWHDNPEKRPDFEQINSRLDTILVELAIADRHGRAFWSEHFLKEHLVPWDDFAKRFYDYLGSSLPEKKRRRYGDIHARTNYLCLRTILTNARRGEDAAVHIERFGEILDLFGPLNKRRASSFLNILDNIRKVVKEKWFHGTVERAEAHRRLEGREAGTFLVRVTPKERDAFVLTVLKKKGATPHNLAIHKREDGTFTFDNNTSKTYLSLSTVVKEIERLSHLQLVPCPGWPFSFCFDEDEEHECESDDLSSSYSSVSDLRSSTQRLAVEEAPFIDQEDQGRRLADVEDSPLLDSSEENQRTWSPRRERVREDPRPSRPLPSRLHHDGSDLDVGSPLPTSPQQSDLAEGERPLRSRGRNDESPDARLEALRAKLRRREEEAALRQEAKQLGQPSSPLGGSPRLGRALRDRTPNRAREGEGLGEEELEENGTEGSRLSPLIGRHSIITRGRRAGDDDERPRKERQEERARIREQLDAKIVYDKAQLVTRKDNMEKREERARRRPGYGTLRDEERDAKIEQLRAKIREREREREERAREQERERGRELEMEDGSPKGNNQPPVEEEDSTVSEIQIKRKQREEERRRQRERWQKEEEERKLRRERIKSQLAHPTL